MIDSLKKAEKLFGEKSDGWIEAFHSELISAQNIITELLVALDLERGGEVAKNLLRLYEYMNHELVKANMEKLDTVWVTEEHLNEIAHVITTTLPHASAMSASPLESVMAGICHGVRNGYEVHELQKLLGCTNIIGTDISHSAIQFDSVIEWDFHETKEEWIQRFDFIYTNSLDHSYDPFECIVQWMKCLKWNGACFIHWSIEHSFDPDAPFRDDSSIEDEIDCFKIDLEELEAKIRSLGYLTTVHCIAEHHYLVVVKNPLTYSST